MHERIYVDFIYYGFAYEIGVSDFGEVHPRNLCISSQSGFKKAVETHTTASHEPMAAE